MKIFFYVIIWIALIIILWIAIGAVIRGIKGFKGCRILALRNKKSHQNPQSATAYDEFEATAKSNLRESSHGEEGANSKISEQKSGWIPLALCSAVHMVTGIWLLFSIGILLVIFFVTSTLIGLDFGDLTGLSVMPKVLTGLSLLSSGLLTLAAELIGMLVIAVSGIFLSIIYKKQSLESEKFSLLHNIAASIIGILPFIFQIYDTLSKI